MIEYNFKNWEVIIDNPDLVVESNRGRICKMALDKDIKKVAARADLIAAAPELLEAAENLLNTIYHNNDLEWENIEEYERLVKIIKKAKGDDK